MKKLYLMLVIIGCVPPFSLRSQSQSSIPSGDQTTKDRISITISAKQAAFKVGDPIIIAIVVKNISEYRYCEKNILEHDHAEWNGFNVEVRDAGKNEVPQISKPLLPLRQRPELSGSRGLLCIALGDTFKESLIANQIMNMSEPGTYSVQIVHRDQRTNAQVKSNVLLATIMQ